MTDAVDLPAPLQGCLYCHAEGTITLAEGRKVLGLGSGLPTLTCSSCGSVALFEQSATQDSEQGLENWRIRYKSVNKAPRYYYVHLYLGKAGWLVAETALEISRIGYVQRQRVQQAQRGEFDWLRPAALVTPPPLMSPDEIVFVTIEKVNFQQSLKAGSMLSQGEETVLDSGRLYLTDRKIHMIGHRRDWSHKLSDIQRIEYDEERWRVYVGDFEQHYQGANIPQQIDAQLFTAIVKQISHHDE